MLEIYVGRADAHLRLGSLEAAVADLAHALRWAHLAPMAEDTRAAKLAGIKRQLADAYRNRGAYDRATALLEQGLQFARGTTGDRALRATRSEARTPTRAPRPAPSSSRRRTASRSPRRAAPRQVLSIHRVQEQAFARFVALERARPHRLRWTTLAASGIGLAAIGPAGACRP